MTSLDQISIESIETKIMSILYANIDTCFNQFALFDKLIKDKFPENYNTTINPTIKAKFLLVLRNLASRYDDISVIKSNNVFSVTCLSDKHNLANVKEYTPIVQTPNVNIMQNNVSNNQISPNMSLEYNDLINYIIDNNLNEDIDYVDPFDGNTIYHDLVATNNLEKISKLIEANKFNYWVKNKYGFTPIQLTKNVDTIIMISNGLAKKYTEETTKLNNKITELELKNTQSENKIKLYESKEYKNETLIKTAITYILWTKLSNQFEKNKSIVGSLFMLFLIYLFLF